MCVCMHARLRARARACVRAWVRVCVCEKQPDLDIQHFDLISHVVPQKTTTTQHLPVYCKLHL